MSLSFKGQTVVILGLEVASSSARYSLLFASRGANVVVNDFNPEAAQKVVDQIVNGELKFREFPKSDLNLVALAGGKAVANSSSATDGAAVIKSALDAFGSVTILINNAGILRDKGFKNMSDNEWDQIMEVHLKAAFACTKAAWPHFRKQKFGRVLNTASAAGLYGNFGQANYSAAKMALVGFTKTIAIEGAKYGIKSTVIAPIAASPMTETIMPPEMLANLQVGQVTVWCSGVSSHSLAHLVAPFVLAVCHPDGPDASGKVFEVGAGFVAEIRWERSHGGVFKTDSTFTPSAVKAKWSEVTDFSKPSYPKHLQDQDNKGNLAIVSSLKSNPNSSSEVRYDGKTVIVTGAGAGLGRIYALMYAKLGANVVINDVNEKGAHSVVDEVIKAGGKATAVVCSAENGETIVKAALEKFGGVHVLIANAGILRDKSFQAMTEQEWDLVLQIHLRGTYKCAKAVWPIFQQQKFGRIVTTSSPSGICQREYLAIFSRSALTVILVLYSKVRTHRLDPHTCIEGKKYNILANAIAPSAGTAMTATVWTQEMMDTMKPDFIAPIVGYLSSADNEETSGCLFEVAGGWAAQIRWQRSGGHSFPSKTPYTPEDVVAKWKSITSFDDRATHPATTSEALEQVNGGNFGNNGEGAKAKL
ncbi:peroxisomal hydratase-dehydrogenase-epimerase [Mycena galopus ATCC 62051]|nr:peroxisomal hydratase-dehydrogenase-epimerase [Mycena galopus ATCC 62051]